MFTPKILKIALRFLGEHFMSSIHHPFLIYKKKCENVSRETFSHFLQIIFYKYVSIR